MRFCAARRLVRILSEALPGRRPGERGGLPRNRTQMSQQPAAGTARRATAECDGGGACTRGDGRREQTGNTVGSAPLVPMSVWASVRQAGVVGACGGDGEVR